MDIDVHYCVRLLQSCKTQNTINQGKQLHLLFFKKGLLGSVLAIGNRLLQFYSRCGAMSDAWLLFEEMPHRNCFSWNTMIEGYMKSGSKEKSLEVFNLMPCKNDFSWNMVISGFAKACELEIARSLFNDMPSKNGVAWNSMIHGYARNGCPRDAVRLFKELKSYDDMFIMATVIGACTDLEAVKCGKQIHARIVIDGLEFDSVLGSSLVNLYGKCGDLGSAASTLNLMKEQDDFSLSSLVSSYANCDRMDDARRIFDRKDYKCAVLWNSMISGYISCNEEAEALVLYKQMRAKEVQEDSSTLASVMSACCSLGYLQQGKQMHCHSCKLGFIDDIVVASALVDMYSKCGNHDSACQIFHELNAYDTILLNSMITIYSSCGRVEDAKQIFEKMPIRSLVSWNSMIVALSQNGCPIEALHLFCRMNSMDLRIDKFSVASVISACASISLLELGEQAFARATVIGLQSDQIISSSLVDLYCKCGLVECGRKIFDTMTKSDEVSWNSMLMGYATNGYGFEALILFEEMRNAGVRPTDITFTGVLSACDHCGLVEEGWKWFEVMKGEYHVKPGIEHYSCMIDLFSRAGCLEKAINLLQHIPFEADASMWLSVLRGCVEHGDKALGKKVAEKIIELDPENSGAYIQLSAMFATSGDWERSALVRKVMRKQQVKKNPGCSWGDY